MSDKAKTVDSEAVLQIIGVNPARSTRRVSGVFGILQSSVVGHLHNIGKGIRSYRIVTHVTKIFQNFWPIVVVSARYRLLLIRVSNTKGLPHCVIYSRNICRQCYTVFYYIEIVMRWRGYLIQTKILMTGF